MKEKLAVCLMLKILEMVKESGASRTEAEAALRAAEAMVPDLDLSVKPFLEFYSESSETAHR